MTHRGAGRKQGIKNETEMGCSGARCANSWQTEMGDPRWTVCPLERVRESDKKNETRRRTRASTTDKQSDFFTRQTSRSSSAQTRPGGDRPAAPRTESPAQSPTPSVPVSRLPPPHDAGASSVHARRPSPTAVRVPTADCSRRRGPPPPRLAKNPSGTTSDQRRVRLHRVTSLSSPSQAAAGRYTEPTGGNDIGNSRPAWYAASSTLPTRKLVPRPVVP